MLVLDSWIFAQFFETCLPHEFAQSDILISQVLTDREAGAIESSVLLHLRTRSNIIYERTANRYDYTRAFIRPDTPWLTVSH